MQQEDRDILYVALFTFITVAIWILFELTKTTKTSTVSSNMQKIIRPLSPTIDTETIGIIESKNVY